ncbi:hypothetical protein FDP41_002913 [Naegleria fowleri]|uniref:Uncharacterized protein n=1 Tax=Naegleria fowleri TaxID=5763 RepID=A0A6A5BX89_NAEFO|nr:uncharacterized protein FDP41_002913 [Naegleria fowleri]KAF0978398.1 hypothetical protein FDP41_002913 [Naegleria fowleri]
MPSAAKQYTLFTKSEKVVKIAVKQNLCLFLIVGDQVFDVNKEFSSDQKLNFTSPATNDSPFVSVSLYRLDEEHFSGRITVDTEDFQVIPPLTSSYKLYITTEEYDANKHDAVDVAASTLWKTLKIVSHVDSHNQIGLAYTLNEEVVELAITRDSLVYRLVNEDVSQKQNPDVITNFNLHFNETADHLYGYFKRNSSDKLFVMKGILDGKFEKPKQYNSGDAKLSVEDLLSLSPLFKDQDKYVDKAQIYASDGFMTLMLYCMKEDWRKFFFGKNDKPYLDNELRNILNTNIQGEETAEQFYAKYAVPYIAHVVYNSKNRDSATDSVDIKRVQAFLDKGCGYDPNYVHQTNLLYRYGYMKAVSKMQAYLDDQKARGSAFWAQQMLTTLKQPHVIIELIGMLENVTSFQDEIQQKLNSWIFKMNILDPSTACSKELTMYMVSGMLDRIISHHFINSLDDDMNLTTIPGNEFIERFLQALDNSADHLVDEQLVQQALRELTQQARQKYELSIALYQFSCVIGAAQKFIKDDALLAEKLAQLSKKSSFHEFIFSRIPASRMKMFCSMLSFAAGIVSSVLLGMFGDFNSLSLEQKIITVTTLVTFMLKDALKPLVQGVDKIFRYSLGFWERFANRMVLLNTKPFVQALGTFLSKAVKTLTTLWTKISAFLFKALKMLSRVCQFILQVLAIAMSVFDLLDSIKAGDTWGIALNAIMIGAAVGELIAMFIGLFVSSMALSVIGAIFIVIGVIALLIDIFRPRETEVHKFVFSDEMSLWRLQDRSEMEMWMSFEEDSHLISKKGGYQLNLVRNGLRVVNHHHTSQIIWNIELNGTKADKQVVLNISDKKVSIFDTDSTEYRILYFTNEFTSQQMPLFLCLNEDGSLSVRTKDSSQNYALTYETLKVVANN